MINDLGSNADWTYGVSTHINVEVSFIRQHSTGRVIELEMYYPTAVTVALIDHLIAKPDCAVGSVDYVRSLAEAFCSTVESYQSIISSIHLARADLGRVLTKSEKGLASFLEHAGVQ